MKRFAALVAIVFGWLAAPLLAADGRPNILVILADDLGYSDPGCYGGEIATPHLDRLAAGGIRFSQFYNCARCCPTRASLLTGAYAHRVGLAKNGRTLSAAAPTIAERLKGAGYQTAMSGKWHLSALPTTLDEERRIAWMNHELGLGIPFADPATYPTRRGFDRYFGVIWGVVNHFDPFSLTDGAEPVRKVPKDFYLTDAITDSAIEYLREFAGAEEPFFLYVAHTAPHWPLHARPEDIAKYKHRYDAGWDALRKDRFGRQVELGIFPASAPRGETIVRGPAWDERTADQRDYLSAKMQVHAAMVDRLDQGVGRIVAALQESGQLDNTAIVFLSDNGASPEIPGPPGYDRPAKTRDGRAMLRDAELQQPRHRGQLGTDESYTGIGAAWASAANTPLRYWKKESYEGGCRTPCIVHWPAGLKARRGGIVRDVGHVIDLSPTFLELASIPVAGEFAMDGKSLTPVLRGEEHSGHERLFFEHEGGRAVREGNWKIVSLPKGEWELFHLADDPGETNNLAGQHPDLVSRLVAEHERWLKGNEEAP
ncbi:MAG: arylsulfatase [Pirellulaceae bacterium]